MKNENKINIKETRSYLRWDVIYYAWLNEMANMPLSLCQERVDELINKVKSVPHECSEDQCQHCLVEDLINGGEWMRKIIEKDAENDS